MRRVIDQLAAKQHTPHSTSQEFEIRTLREPRIAYSSIMRTRKWKRNMRPIGGLARTLSNVRRVALSKNSTCRAAYLKNLISERQGNT